AGALDGARWILGRGDPRRRGATREGARRYAGDARRLPLRPRRCAMRIARWTLALAIVACDRRVAPAAQILLYVDTDGPIAPTRGPIPLFDRIRVDILPTGSDVPCSGCSNIIAVDRDMFHDRKVSFGIVPRRDGARVRIRLFRSDFVDAVSGEPDPVV